MLFSIVLLEAVLVFVLLYFSGFVINSLVDRNIDKKYETFKVNISEAVDVLGTTRVKYILAVQVGLAILLGIHISYVLQNVLIIVLVGLGVLFGLGYSAQPFHFKVRGVWHAIALASSAFFIPLLFIYIVVAETIELLDVLLILGVTIAHYSMEMANQAADHFEDSEEGIRTPTVRLGLENALKSSIIMTTVGMVMIIITIAMMFLSSGITFGLGLEGLPIPAISVVLVFVAIVIGIGYYFPLKGLRDLYVYSTDSSPLEERITRIKGRVHYASWQASGILGVVFTLCILFVGSLSTTVLEPSDNAVEPETGEELDINTLRIDNVIVTTWNEGTSKNYAELNVRLFKNTEQPEGLTEVKAIVEAKTADETEPIDIQSANLDTNGRTTITVKLYGHNESKVSYDVYLEHQDKYSSYIWTEPSAMDLYIHDASLRIIEPGVFYHHAELVVECFNDGKVRPENSLKIYIEWTPLILDLDWQTNNATVNPGQMWKVTFTGEIYKEILLDSPPLKIYLTYNDKEVEVMQLKV